MSECGTGPAGMDRGVDRERLLGELRPVAFGIAYRMLGSVSEAEDIVQEAVLRVHRTLEAGQIAVLDRGEEPSCQLVALLPSRLEAGSPLLDVAPGAGGELAHVGLALPDDRGDLRIPIVEHVVEQQDGSLLRRKALQEHQQRHRQRVACLNLAGRIAVTVGEDWLR